MLIRAAIISLALVARASALRPTESAQACRPQDATSDFLVGKATSLVTQAGASSFRATTMNLPQLTASDVQLVSDETVCAAALRTYASAVPADSGTSYASVYVVRLGNYYLVTEPTQKAGEWLRAIVVNTVYTKTAGVFGF